MVARAKPIAGYGSHSNPPAPVLTDMLAYHRAVQRLQHVRRSLERALQNGSDAPPAFSFLLVEQGLWTRYVRRAQDLWMTVHTDGPQAGEPVVLTAEVVLDAIIAGQISIKSAIRRGLVVVAPAPQNGGLAALLKKALTKDNEQEGRAGHLETQH
jgi:hypothetical protein